MSMKVHKIVIIIMWVYIYRYSYKSSDGCGVSDKQCVRRIGEVGN